jgi:ParB family chromosome partitioning protein
MSAVVALPTGRSTDLHIDTRAPLSLVEFLSWGRTDATVTQMPIGAILISPNGDGNATDLDGLVASIRARGVLQPLIVAPDGRLLAGRRRLEAARRAGLEVVPVHVCAVNSERSAIEISLVENVERSDLDPITRAKAYRALIVHGASVEEVADLVGQGTRHVYQLLQLLDLHPEVQQAVHTRALSFADARALVLLERDDQVAVLQEIRASAKPLTSRQVKVRVDTRRVMRLVKDNTKRDEQPHSEDNPANPNSGLDENTAAGNYAALFESDAPEQVVEVVQVANPLEQLNVLIAEMVAAAQGEDQVRAWARRLSHILGILQDQESEREKENGKKKSAGGMQDRLL